MCRCECPHMSTGTTCIVGAHRSQNRVLVPLNCSCKWLWATIWELNPGSLQGQCESVLLIPNAGNIFLWYHASHWIDASHLTWHHLSPLWRAPFVVKPLTEESENPDHTTLLAPQHWEPHRSCRKSTSPQILNPVFSSPWELGYQNSLLFSIPGTVSSYRTIQFLTEIKPICA